MLPQCTHRTSGWGWSRHSLTAWSLLTYFSFLLVLGPVCLCAPGKFHGPTSWQDWSDHWWRGCQAPRAHAAVCLGVRRPHWVQEPHCRDYERPHSLTAILSPASTSTAISVLAQQGRRRGKGGVRKGKAPALCWGSWVPRGLLLIHTGGWFSGFVCSFLKVSRHTESGEPRGLLRSRKSPESAPRY